MRQLLAIVLCATMAGVPLFAQSGSTQAGSGQNQGTASPGQTNGQPPESSDPVLIRRSPQERQGDATQNAPEGSTAPQNGPVLQQRVPPPTHIPMAQTIPASTQFRATLDEELSSKTSQPGDGFTATLAEPLRNQQGNVLIPAGVKLHGVVQNAESGKVLPSLRGKGKLSLRFTEVQLPNGQEIPLEASLLSISQNKGKASASQEGEITGGVSGKDTAKDVGIGAGVGTVAGLIFGSALKGLAIGAIAGGGYVLANAGKDVTIPANTVLQLRVDQYVTLPVSAITAQH